MITIIAIGKKHDPNLASAINDYEKRLRTPFETRWVLLPYSAKNDDEARQDESERIINQLRPNDFVILLDERGQRLSSPGFSTLLASQQNIVIIIGGAYGVNNELRQRADQVISLSDMVFPHQLVRLILIEQIYRAQAITTNHPYHHS